MVKTKIPTNIVYKYIGNRIYELRLACGVSRKVLGKKIGVTQQQCQKYEAGINKISAGRLVLIAKALNTPIDYFYKNADKGIKSELKTTNQRMCIEVSKNFMKIQNPIHQDAIISLVTTLAKKAG
jgi:transcriptional regulator with XRE-family HTH domain